MERPTTPTVPGQDPLDRALRHELERGEIVRWQGRPLARIALSSFLIWIFAVPWTAFSVFWTAMAFHAMDAEALGSTWGWIFPLWGTPFIAIGVKMLSAPFAPLFTARRTLYAITDRRVIEIKLWRSLDVSSVEAARIGSMQRKERKDGSGTVGILRRAWTDSDGDQRTDWLRIGEVPQVRDVERRLRELASQGAPQG